MSGTQVGGLEIELFDRHGNISRNAREGTMNRIFLNSSEHAVAAAMGLRADDVAALIGRHGRHGLAGKDLMALDPGSQPFPTGPRKTSPFPDTDGKYRTGDTSRPTPDSGGRLYDDEDDEKDPMKLRAKPIGVQFPKRATVK
jgi:hypothetical protein